MKEIRKEQNSLEHNRLLLALPAKDYDFIISQAEVVELRQEERIYESKAEIRYVYFPITALLSWVTITETGDSIEVGISGSEAMAGIPIFLECNLAPYQVHVQLSGSALRMKADTFKELCDRFPSLQKRLRQYTYLMLNQFAQSCACNRFHSVEQRLSRWLLTALDRSPSQELTLTKEILANMIGARRPAVSLVVGKLKRAGLIHSSRGKITVVNRKGLSKAACECYEIVRKVFDWFMEEKID
jgi:CRP-like cAMP-binding protein